MLSVPQNDPKIVTVRVCRAEDLKIHLPENKSKKKTTTKWRVVFMGATKKKASEEIDAPGGNPRWDCQIDLKLSTRHEPVCLLIIDSQENHAGQVILPPTQIPALPADHDPWAPWRAVAAPLEPTKKTSYPSGILYYWAYVAEYHTSDGTGSSNPQIRKNSIAMSIGSLGMLPRSRSDFKAMMKGSSSNVSGGAPTKKKGGLLARIKGSSKKNKDTGSTLDVFPSQPNMSRSMGDLYFGSDAGSMVGSLQIAGDIGIDSDEDGHVGSSVFDGSSGIGSDNGPGYLGLGSQVGEGHWSTGGGSVGRALGTKIYHKRNSSGISVTSSDAHGHADGPHGEGYEKHQSSYNNSYKSSSGATVKLSKADSGNGTMGGRRKNRNSGSLLDLFGLGSGKTTPQVEEPGEPFAPAQRTGSAKSRNSMSKRDMLDELHQLRQENEELSRSLLDANRLTATLRDQVTTYQSLLTSRERDVDRLSRSLCDLRNKLLKDGHTGYLEMPGPLSSYTFNR